MGTFLAGWAGLAAVGGALGWGAWSMRRGVLPEWTGAPARLAELVLGLAALFATAQLAGSVKLLRPLPLLMGEVAAGLGMVAGGRWLARRVDHASVREPAPAASAPRWETALAAVGVAAVALQWATHVADALGRGMTHSDTLWYHQPFAIRFVQDHGFGTLEGVGASTARWYSVNSQLLHALGILPFDRDVLSPFLNLGWAGLALLAAWCIGRRWGLAHLSLLGAAVVLGLPILTGTHPGQASSDLACGALLLASVALLLEGQLASAPTVVAGLAAGLAIATKLTAAVPLAVLALGLVVVASWRRRPLRAVAWAVALGATGSFLFLRNWVQADNPLPWWDIDVGPFSFRATVDEGGSTMWEQIRNGDTWRDIYLPGLHHGLAAGWFVVLAVAVMGAAVVVVRRCGLERVAALMAVAGLVAYPFTPLTGGFSFVFNLRFLCAALLLGFALAPLALPSGERWRRGGLVSLLALLAVGLVAPDRERVAAWPEGLVVPTLLVVLALLTAGGTVGWLASRSRLGLRVTGAALAAAVVLGGAWAAQRQYLDHRYVDAGLDIDEIHEHFRGVRGADVAVFGTDETLPMFGLDLSNRVRRGDDPPPDIGDDTCRDWRRAIGGRYDYVVLTRFGLSYFVVPPEDVIAGDPAATEVVRDGDSAVYRIDGALDPDRCP